MFSMITKFAKLALSTIFFLGGIAVFIITIMAIFERGYDFLPCTIFLIGSIGMIVEGVKGFKEVKKEFEPKVLTIYYSN